MSIIIHTMRPCSLRGLGYITRNRKKKNSFGLLYMRMTCWAIQNVHSLRTFSAEMSRPSDRLPVVAALAAVVEPMAVAAAVLHHHQRHSPDIDCVVIELVLDFVRVEPLQCFVVMVKPLTMRHHSFVAWRCCFGDLFFRRFCYPVVTKWSGVNRTEVFVNFGRVKTNSSIARMLAPENALAQHFLTHTISSVFFFFYNLYKQSLFTFSSMHTLYASR